VRVNRANGSITVEKLTLVIDCGIVIHPDSAEAQVEGGALWGLSLTLYEGTEFVKGQPKDTNLDSYQVLRVGQVPEIEVEFLPSVEVPVGLGEPAMTPIAPAIANAIFAATGARLRDLPIRPQAVMQALARES
jgi:isoquinoline 1-oxidoreductase subunit beta